MNVDHIITKISTELGDRLLELDRKSGHRVYFNIAPETVKAASQMMLEDVGARFQIATGVDIREGIEVLYHWALDGKGLIVTMRTLLGHEAPELDSIAVICPAAEWIEREMWELLGIHFRGHPDLRHLLLADDWPQDNYPLRRNHPLPGDGEATP
jgi:Ni,Fe-hydrogenase III component G